MSLFFFCKQKTAYEMRISDWSSDVCSSDLAARVQDAVEGVGDLVRHALLDLQAPRIGVHQARELGDPHHALAGQVGDVGNAADRGHVVFAGGAQRDVAQQHDVVVAGAFEGAAQDLFGVERVTAEPDRKSTRLNSVTNAHLV